MVRKLRRGTIVSFDIFVLGVIIRCQSRINRRQLAQPIALHVITTVPPLDNTRTTEEHSIITTEEDSVTTEQAIVTTEEDSVTTEQAIVTIEASLQSARFSNVAPKISEIIAKENHKNFLLAKLAEQ